MRFRLYILLPVVFLVWTACEPPQIRYEIPPPYPPVVTPQVPEISSETADRRFLVIGDWGGGNKWRPGSVYRQHEVADGMAAVVTDRTRGADFVISTGDNFYEKGVGSVFDRKWRTIFENVYDAARFPMMFYAVLGNHDYGKDPFAQVAYHLLVNDHATGRWFMPERYYTFSDSLNDKTTVQFFALDTQVLLEEDWYRNHQKRSGEPDGESAKHQNWLIEQLAASRARWKIVFMHHPVFSNGRHGDTEELKISLKPLLEQYGVNAVFSGHDHNLEVIKPLNGVRYFVSGAGANVHDVAWRENTAFAYARTGFMWCRLTRDELLVVVNNRRGEPLWVESVDWR